MKRRSDLPNELIDREEGLRKAMKTLEGFFPRGTGLALMAFSFGEPKGFLSWISNADRKDMISALRIQADRLEAGTADTAGREV